MSEKSVKNTFLMEGLQDFNENQNMCGRDLYTLNVYTVKGKPCSESERGPAGHIFLHKALLAKVMISIL